MIARRCAPFLLITLLTLSVVEAADDPGDWFPDDAVVVGRMKNPRTTVTKAVSLIHMASPLYSNLLLSDDFEFGFTGIDAIDLGQDIWWGAYWDEAGSLEAVGVLAAKDEKMFLKSLDIEADQLSIHRHQSRLIVASSEQIIERMKKRIAGEGASCLHSMSVEQRTVFESYDTSVFINIRQIYQSYLKDAAEGDAAKAKFVEDLAESIDLVDDSIIKFVIRPETALRGLQAVAGAANVVIGGNIDKRAIELECSMETAPAKDAKPAPDSKSADFADLERMPPDRQIYVAGTPPFSCPAGWFLELIDFESHGGDEDKPVVAKKEDQLRRLGKLSFRRWSAAISLPTLISRELRLDMVTEVKQPEAYRLLNNNLAVTQAQFKEFRENRKYEYLPGGESYGESAVDIHRITCMKKEAGNNETYIKLHGPQGMTSRCLYQDSLFVNTVGGGKPAMQSALRRLKSTDSDEFPEELLEVRRKLPEKANYLMLADLSALFSALMTLQIDAKPNPGVFAEIVLDGVAMASRSPSYFGIGLAVQPERTELKLYLPAEQLTSIVSSNFLFLGGIFDF